MRKKIRLALIGLFSWRYNTLLILGIALIGSILWFRLGTLPGSFSQPELMARADASSLKAIVNDPLFLPHKLVQYIFMKIGLHGVFAMRFTSTLFAVVILGLFYRILKSWYTVRIAILGTVVLACSSWFLHWARLGTPHILYANVISLLWVGARLRSQRPRQSTTLFAAVIGVSTLYIPGFIWLLALGALWQRKVILHEFSGTPRLHKLALTMAGLIGITPLVVAFIRNHSLLLTWLGLPGGLPDNPLLIARTLAHIPLWLAVHAPLNPVYWLSSLALLDAVGIVMFGLGFYSLYGMLRLDRIKALLGSLLFSCAIVSLQGFESSIVLLPVYLVISSGIALMLRRWFTVFPNNPFARITGVAIIGSVVTLSCYYQLTSYFVAWPHASPTKSAFQRK